MTNPNKTQSQNPIKIRCVNSSKIYIAESLRGKQQFISLKRLFNTKKQKWRTKEPIYEFVDFVKSPICKPYWDIDLKRGEESDTFNINEVVSCLSNLMDCPISSFFIAEHSREDKISFHITNTFFKTTPENLKSFVDTHKDVLETFGIDKSVYRVGLSKFRCVLSGKEGIQGVLEPRTEGNIENYLIQIYNPENEFFGIEKPKPITKEKSKVVGSSVEMNEEMSSLLSDYPIEKTREKNGSIYHLLAKSFPCPVNKKAHSSNRMYIEQKPDSTIWMLCKSPKCSHGSREIKPFNCECLFESEDDVEFQMTEEFDYDVFASSPDQKRYFENFHLKIQSPFHFRVKIDGDWVYYNKTDLQGLREDTGNFLKEWFKNPEKLSKTRVIFDPNPKCKKLNHLNLFEGFAVKNFPKKPTNIDAIYQHILKLVNYNEKSYKYVLDWIADMFQNPHRSAGTMLCFKSIQGIGKNLFFEKVLGGIMGKQYIKVVNSIENLVGQFVDFSRAILVIVDEIAEAEMSKVRNRLKAFITAEDHTTNIKFEKKCKFKNRTHIVGFSNDSFPKIEQRNRRFFLAESFETSDSVYIDNLLKACTKSGLRIFYEQMISRDLKNYNSVRDRPITQAEIAEKSFSMPVEKQFIQWWLSRKSNFQAKTYSVAFIYDKYTEWSKEMGMTPFGVSKFGHRFGKIEGVSGSFKKQGQRSRTIDWALIDQD